MAAIDKAKLVEDQRLRYIYCRDNGHLRFIQKARKCEDFVNNKQWNPADRSKLDAEGRPALTINKLLPNLASIYGLYLRNRVDVTFRPGKDGTDEVSTILSKLYLHESNDNSLNWVEGCVFLDGAVTGRGFYDVRMSFDKSMSGRIEVVSVNPRNVMIDPDSDGYDSDTWKEVTITKWLSLSDIELAYGKEAAKNLHTEGEATSLYGYDFADYHDASFGGASRRIATSVGDVPHRKIWRVIERQYRAIKTAPHFVDMKTGDTKLISPDLPREKIQALEQYGLVVVKKPVEVIYWTTTCNDILLHHSESPYNHFTIVPFFPIFRYGTTIGLIESQIDAQELYNKVESQMLHVVNTTANSGYIVEKGILANMSPEDLERDGAKTGLVIEVNPGGLGKIQKIQPNQVPTGLDRILYHAAEDLKEISMVSDSMRGFDREDVAAKAIMAKQAMSTGNFAMAMDNLAYTRRLLAERFLDLWQSFYTEPRILNITSGGPTPKTQPVQLNQPTPEGVVANDITVGEYSVVITFAPDRETFEDQQFAEILELRKMGINIPDKYLIGTSHIDQRSEIIQELSPSQEQSQAQQQTQQLEQQLKQAELAKVQAEARRFDAESVFTLVKAQNTSDTDPNPKEQAQPDYEMAKLAHDKSKHEDEMSLRKQELYSKIALERSKMAQTRGSQNVQ